MLPRHGVAVLVAFGWFSAEARAEVSPTGAYRTEVAIQVPAFRGLEPAIALAYDSTAGDGPVGLGWRLAAGSTIYRAGPRGGVPRYDGDDIYLIDGQELVPCGDKSPSPGCKAGGTHTGRIETFEKIVYDDPQNTWTVWQRDGTQRTYVLQLRAMPGAGLSYRWGLDHVRDVRGNTVWYEYTCPAGEECVLRAIRWGAGRGCGQLPPDTQPGTMLDLAEIKFHWVGRTDVTDRGTGRALLASTQLLQTIEVRSAGRITRAYALGYAPMYSATSGAALLQTVQEYGTDARLDSTGKVIGGTRLPAISLETESMLRSWTGWTPSTRSLPAGANASIPTPATPPEYDEKITPTDSRGDGRMKLRWLTGDVNGDGISDYVLIGGIQIGVAIGRRDGTSTFYVDTWSGQGWYGALAVDPTQNVHAYIADFDGDGRADIMQAIDVLSCDAQCPCTGPLQQVCHHTGFRIAKFRDDGTWTYIMRSTTHPYETNVNNTSHFGWSVSITLPFGPVAVTIPIASGTIWSQSDTHLGDNWFVGDYDGDGRNDFMGISRYIRTLPDGSTMKAVRLRAVRSLGDDVASTWIETDTDWDWSNNHSSANRFFVGDTDGDRRADFMSVGITPSTLNVAFQVGRSDGTGNFVWTTRTTSRPFVKHDFWMPGDPDGDGRVDFFHIEYVAGSTQFRQHHGKVEAAYSDGEGGFVFGSSLETGEPWHFPIPCTAEPWQPAPWIPADVDGDGRTDLIHPVPTHTYGCLETGPGTRNVRAHVVLSRPGDTFVVGQSLGYGPYIPGCGMEISMTAGDFNGDGRDDYLHAHSVPNARQGCIPENWKLDVTPTQRFTTDHGNWTPTDLDGDGRGDLFYVVFDNPGYTVHTLIADATGGYTRSQFSLGEQRGVIEALDQPAATKWMAVELGSPGGGGADGKVDLVLVDEAADTVGLRVTSLISLGDGQFEARQLPLTGEGVFQRAGRWRPADIDGDGLTDLVHVGYANAGIRVDVLRASTDGQWTWTYRGHYPGQRFTDAVSWRVIDVDGDGRSDLAYVHVQGTQNRVEVLHGQGDGTFIEVGFPTDVPLTMPATSLWQTADVNADGLGDLILVDEERAIATGRLRVHTLVGLGDGHFTYRASAPLQVQQATVHDRHGFRAADLDGDGRTDLVHVTNRRSTSGTSTTITALINGHDEWKASVGSTSFSFTDSPTWRLTDATGDGRPDLIYVLGDVQVMTADLPDDRVTKQRNGIGGAVAIRYGSTAGAHAMMPWGMPLPVVDQVDTIDELGGGTTSERYSYAGARWSLARRTFLGFSSVTHSDGRAVRTTNYHQTDTCGIRPVGVETRDAAGVLFGATSHSYVVPSPDNKAPFLCLPWIDDAYECEGSPQCRLTRTSHEFDLHGNEVRTTALGDVQDATDDRMIEAPVRPNPTDYQVSSPAYRAVYERDSAGAWQLLAKDRFSYDGQASGLAPQKLAELRMTEAWDSTANAWRASKLEYDARGNVVKTTGPGTPHEPKGTWQTIEYDCTFAVYPVKTCDARFCRTTEWDLVLGAPTRETDPNGAKAERRYDPLGRVIRVDPAGGGFTTTEYAPETQWGTVQQRTTTRTSDDSADGVLAIERYHDGLGRTTRTVLEDGTQSEIEYDRATDRPARSTDPRRTSELPQWTGRTYDALGRPTQVTWPDGAQRRLEYRRGEVSTRDEMGGEIVYRRDAFGRTVDVAELVATCPIGQTECSGGRDIHTLYAYDGLDRLRSVIDAKQNITRIDWDSLGGKTELCDPDSGCTKYEYNADGTLAAQIDANRSRIELGYDELGRAIQKRYFDRRGGQVRTVDYTWDRDPRTSATAGASLGRRVAVVDRGGPTDRDDYSAYDEAGRETTRERCLDARCMAWAMTYDAAGRLYRQTYPDATGKVSGQSEIVVYRYNEGGRLDRMPGFITRVEYDGAGRVRLVRLANGTEVKTDVDERRSTVRHSKVTGPNAATIFEETYTYDPKARVTGHTTKNAGTVTAQYGYDTLDRLRKVQSSDVRYARDFVYDEVGNLIEDTRNGKHYRTDPAHVHAMTSTDAGHRRTYDARGNLVTSERLALTWNGDGMPEHIDDTIAGTSMVYGYDDDGQRVSKNGPQGRHYYFSPLIEVDEHGDVITTYYAGDERIARRDIKGLAFFHHDAIGSVRVMTDAHGVVENRYDYGAYGDQITATGAMVNERRFLGAVADDDSGLTYLNARYYDPAVGTFISADTIVPEPFDPQTLNRYAFALNSPTNYADPSGHEGEPRMQYDLYNRPIGKAYYHTGGGTFVEPGGKPPTKSKSQPRAPKPASQPRAWASVEPPVPPAVHVYDHDAILKAGRDEAMRTVVAPMAAVIGGGLVAGGLIAGAIVAGPALLSGEALLSAPVLRGSMLVHRVATGAGQWFLKNAATDAGLFSIGLAVDINLVTQGYAYDRDPEHFKFDNASLAYDMITAPVGNGVARSVFGKYPLFVKGAYDMRWGLRLPVRSSASTFLKAEGCFALYSVGMSGIRAAVTDTPLTANLASSAPKFAAGFSRTLVLESLVAMYPQLFPGGRDGATYTLVGKGLGIATDVLNPAPTKNGAK